VIVRRSTGLCRSGDWVLEKSYGRVDATSRVVRAASSHAVWWVRARYVAERHELEARYQEWEIIGEVEYWRPIGGTFSPWK
jgi:hypothetical protein